MAEDGRGRIEIESLSKSYTTPSHRVDVLQDVSLEVPAAGALAVVGPSGSGKSTLLHLIGALERPTSGKIRVDGFDPSEATEPELARFRNQVIGFVFQDHHLLPQFTVLQNVMLPGLAGWTARENRGDSGAGTRARELLDSVGLAERLEHRPAELSGGERQRAAVARALLNRPDVLLCDEPTGNLDRNTAESVADLLFELHQAERSTLVVVTHNHELASRFGEQVRLENGTCSTV